MSTGSKALVLGATGHIGSAITRQLLERGYAVTAATRRQKLPKNLSGLDLAVVSGDADEPGRLARWVAGHDVVVDAAAPYPIQLFHATQRAEAEPLRYAEGRTRALLDAVSQHDAHLLLISSFVTLPRTLHPWKQMRSRMVRATHPYFAVKERIEALVFDATGAGLRATVINPTVCLGPWDMKPSEFCLIPQLLRGRVLASTTTAINVVDVRDVAQTAVAALESAAQDAAGPARPIPVSGHNIRSSDLVAEICRQGGVAAPSWRAPVALGMAMAYWAEAALALSGRPSPYPALVPLLLGECYPMSLSPEQRALGVTPLPLEQTLLESIEWYQSIGYC